MKFQKLHENFQSQKFQPFSPLFTEHFNKQRGDHDHSQAFLSCIYVSGFWTRRVSTPLQSGRNRFSSDDVHKVTYTDFIQTLSLRFHPECKT